MVSFSWIIIKSKLALNLLSCCWKDNLSTSLELTKYLASSQIKLAGPIALREE